jgi:ribonucleoside-diphosphate reductase alpha chain
VSDQTSQHAITMPRVRRGETTRFVLGDHVGYLTSGRTAHGTIGEVSLRIAKQGSTLGGLTDALGSAMSLGLQAGAPLQEFTDDYTGTRFAPAGPTDDPDLPHATSVVDYLARRLVLDARAD